MFEWHKLKLLCSGTHIFEALVQQHMQLLLLPSEIRECSIVLLWLENLQAESIPCYFIHSTWCIQCLRDVPQINAQSQMEGSFSTSLVIWFSKCVLAP